MAKVATSDWCPVGVDSLEPAAEDVVRSVSNTLVVAGPGAGKTELLAQRACFLFETGVCRSPTRILAISFKRDAASNLAERVQARSPQYAHRFLSITLDAFAKSLVDRFRMALPPAWRPDADYDVMTESLRPAEIRDWAAGAGCSRASLASLSNTELRSRFDHVCHGIALPYEVGCNDKQRRVGLAWWEACLTRQGALSLSFPMLNRLAAYLIRLNPLVCKALRKTYGVVFLDEFQDTTEAQFDLITAAFEGSDATLTAVGDRKQRIMLWAGAMAEVFPVFGSRFAAETTELLRNYRSAPELIEIQNRIAETLEAESPPAKCATEGLEGLCQLLEFSCPEDEAEHLSTEISELLTEGGFNPRDIVVLVRQKCGEMITHVRDSLRALGIDLRDESELQTLLSEPVCQLILLCLELVVHERAPGAWDDLIEALCRLHGWGDEEDGGQAEEMAGCVVKLGKTALATGTALDALPKMIINAIGERAIANSSAQYAKGEYMAECVQGLEGLLRRSSNDAESDVEAVDIALGKRAVPAMTIHKSKGLEFRLVIFLGLEDSQWWNFKNQPEEEQRGFFVAFSRAIERVVFTYCDVRESQWGRKKQSRSETNGLFQILKAAGVPTTDFRAQPDD